VTTHRPRRPIRLGEPPSPRRTFRQADDVESARAALEDRARTLTGPQVFVRLVDANVEWVCSILIGLEPKLVSPEVARDALHHDRASRDQLLRSASLDGRESLRAELLTRTPLLRSARDCLLERFREATNGAGTSSE
jgi:hypothetical protein